MTVALLYWGRCARQARFQQLVKPGAWLWTGEELASNKTECIQTTQEYDLDLAYK